MFHFSGILAPYPGHCRNPEKAYEQYEQGRAIMAEALNSGVQPLIVSYETLLTLQMPYLQQIYFQLGIVSKHRPDFVNGNTKKLYPGRSHEPVPHVEQELIRQDETVLKSSIMARKVRLTSSQKKRIIALSKRLVQEAASKSTPNNDHLQNASTSNIRVTVSTTPYTQRSKEARKAQSSIRPFWNNESRKRSAQNSFKRS
jgi:hypothetical protein